MMKTYIIEILCALLGSFGFSLLFNLKKEKIFLSSRIKQNPSKICNYKFSQYR